MDFLRHYLLTILIFAPTAGAVLVLMAKSRDAVRWTALAATIVTFLLSLMLLLPGVYDWNAGIGYNYA
jgi:NADH:ubiquinone oxidoreductase subunit 4 (subunit M)